jgi:hypothetical protein
VRRALIGIAVATALGGVVRWAAFEATFPTRPTGDEVYYLGTAIAIAEGRGHEWGAYRYRASWPPAQSWWLSWFVDADLSRSDPALVHHLRTLDPDHPPRRVAGFLAPLTAAQVALGTLLVAVTGALGLALFGPRVGVVAAAVAALFPNFVANSHYLWSETLFAVLLTTALVGVAAVEQRPSRAVAALTGAVFGVAALAREIALPCAAAAAVWWLVTARPERRLEALIQGALLLVCAAAVVAPWTARNYRLFDRFVPVATVGWHAMREGNTPGEWDEVRVFRARYYAIEDEMERMDLARREALELIAAQQPGWILRKAASNLPLLFDPHTIAFFKIRQGSYGTASPASIRGFVALTALAYATVVAAGVLGIAAAPGRGRRVLPLLLFGVLVAVHVVSNANSRYRFPFMPLLVVYASAAVADWPQLRRQLTGARLVAALLVLLFFFAVCVPAFAPEARKLWASGASG